MKQLDDNTKQSHIVAGIRFIGADDAELAETECKKIAYIKEHINLADREEMRKIYQKAIESRTFQTPIGTDFMLRLRKQLIQSGFQENEIEPIPVYQKYVSQIRKESMPAKERIKPSQKKEKVNKTILSIWLNILLILMVIGMFFIAKSGNNPNIINYEVTLQNKYATWEQDLTERENKVREKELELGIR